MPDAAGALPFYFSGVAGSTGRLVDRDGQEMLIPLRIEPRGIIEPFAWMVECNSAEPLGRGSKLVPTGIFRVGG